MARAIDKRIMLDLIIEAKKTDPETGPFSEWLAEYLVDHLPTLIQQNGPLTLKELKALKEATPLWVLNLTWEQQEPRIMLVRQVVDDWWTCLDFNGLEMFLSKDYGTKYLIYRRLKGKGGLNDGDNN